MITVIDYGAGNLRSVENALRHLGVPYRITSQAAEVAGAKAVLLPGVGHFGQMMRALQQLGIVAPLRSAIHGGVPYLGICLGMQALFERSEEAPPYGGLGILPGTIRRFPESLAHSFKVPHMGWNQLRIAPRRRLFVSVPAEPFVYFAHSYYLPAEENRVAGYTAALCEYGLPFVAAVERGNIFGVQFHPEKSGEAGLRVVANFAALCRKRLAGGTARGGSNAG